MRPCQGGGGSHVARLNFKKSCVDVKSASRRCWKLNKNRNFRKGG